MTQTQGDCPKDKFPRCPVYSSIGRERLGIVAPNSDLLLELVGRTGPALARAFGDHTHEVFCQNKRHALPANSELALHIAKEMAEVDMKQLERRQKKVRRVSNKHKFALNWRRIRTTTTTKTGKTTT